MIKYSCRNWSKGLNNIRVNNNETIYSCKFAEPTKCHMNIFSSILDYSNLRKINCENDRPKIDKVEHVWMNYLSNKDFVGYFNILAYPLTNKIDFSFSKFKSEQDFANKISENINFLNDVNEMVESNSETFIIKKNDTVNIEINLKYNEEISTSRNQIIKEKNIPKLNNILFIFIDKLSRPHFFRKMKLVSHFLEKFNENKNNNSSYEAFQFFKYQTFKSDYFESSIQTMFYNSTKHQTSDNKNMHILSFLKNNGYITGQSANICSKEFFSDHLEREINFYKNTKIDEYDHENVAMFCDPFYFDDSNEENSDTKNVKGINSAFKRCLYGKNSFEYVLDYGYQFWTKYNNNKRFLRLGFFDGNEKTGEVIKYLDKYLYEFLYKLYNENYLENTILFIVSGQGNINTDLFNTYDFEDFLIEKYIGCFFIFMDKQGMNDEKLNNIRINQQTMVTPYDIQKTIQSIVINNFLNEENNIEPKSEEFNIKGKNLFSYINPKERNCQKYRQTSEEVCRCIDF